MAAVNAGLTVSLTCLVVENEARALALLERQLQQLGCATVGARTAAEARRRLAAAPVDLVVCAIELPGETGLDLLRWLRARSQPRDVILLTAQPAVDTAIQALRDGARDYLTKPVSFDSLAAALQRLAQRRRPARAARPLPGTAELPAPPPARQFHIGPVLLDLDRLVLAVNGRPVDATPSEMGILLYLCRNPHRVVTPQELVQSLRGYRIEPQQAPELIRPHISNLRRKLAAAAAEADIVRTVRGVGYMLREAGPAG